MDFSRLTKQLMSDDERNMMKAQFFAEIRNLSSMEEYPILISPETFLSVDPLHYEAIVKCMKYGFGLKKSLQLGPEIFKLSVKTSLTEDQAITAIMQGAKVRELMKKLNS